MRLQPVIAQSIRVPSLALVFRAGEWTTVPDEHLDYLLADEQAYVLREETELGACHVRCVSTHRRPFVYFKSPGVEVQFSAKEGNDYQFPRHIAVQLLKRNEFTRSPMAGVFGAAKRILIIRHGGLGDVLMTLPAVAAIYEAHPHLEIEYATMSPFTRIFDGNPAISRGLPISGCYERAPYDAVVDIRRFIEAAGDSADVNRMDIIARRFDVQLTSYEMPYVVTDADREAAARYVKRRPCVLVQERGSIGRRFVPPSLLADVVRDLTAAGVSCVVAGRTSVKVDGTDLQGSISLPNLFALVEQADCTLCGDSGVLHVANALHRPVVATFGPVRWDLRVKDRPTCVPIAANEYSHCPICNDHQLRTCPDSDQCQAAIPKQVIVDAVLKQVSDVDPVR